MKEIPEVPRRFLVDYVLPPTFVIVLGAIVLWIGSGVWLFIWFKLMFYDCN